MIARPTHPDAPPAAPTSRAGRRGHGVRVGVLALTFALLLPVAGPTAVATTSAAAQAGTGCVQGLRDITLTPDSGKIAGLVRLGGERALGVGSISPGVEKATELRILTAVHTTAGWSFRTTAGPGGSAAALVAIDRAPNGDPWAVGFRYDRRLVQRPLVMRRTTQGWRDASPPARAGIATAIAGDAVDGLWVTTTEVVHGSPSAWLWRRAAGRWRRVPLPAVKGVERFTAVISPSAGRTWVAGTTVTVTGVAPVILGRDGGTWRREPVAAGGDRIVISALFAQGDARVLAAGWSLYPGRIRPVLLARGADGTWRPTPLSGATGAAGVLSDLAGSADMLIAAGSSYLSAAGQWLPAQAFPGSDPGWLVTDRPGWFLQAVTGDPTADGWMAATATGKGPEAGSMLARMCDLTAADDAALRRRLIEQRRRRLERAAERQAAVQRRVERRAGRREAAARVLDVVPAGEIGGGFTLRDSAASLGLPAMTGSYGIDLGDVDGDGRKDLVWSRHGGPLAVYLRTGSGFRPYTDPAFMHVDRHTCIAARLDADGRADIACVTGAMHGLGITSNELYLDPTGGSTRDMGVENGLTDPVARGRVLVALDAENDGDTDLYVAGQERNDGFPTVDRLLTNDGDGHFTWGLSSGLTASFGAACGVARDLDRDGRMDLLVCQDPEAPSGRGLHVYRNLGGTFRDAAGAMGVQTIGEVDVDAGQLDRGGRLDLVQLATDRLRISLWEGGRYVPVLDRSVQDGVAVAIGDVDGDHDEDVYLAMGTFRDPLTDLILLNDGTGRGWTQVEVPDTAAFGPDDVLATDLDNDGRDEFIVVSGRSRTAPMRVIDAR